MVILPTQELRFIPIKALATRDFWKRSFLRDGGQCSEACFLDTRLTHVMTNREVQPR